MPQLKEQGCVETAVSQIPRELITENLKNVCSTCISLLQRRKWLHSSGYVGSYRVNYVPIYFRIHCRYLSSTRHWAISAKIGCRNTFDVTPSPLCGLHKAKSKFVLAGLFYCTYI